MFKLSSKTGLAGENVAKDYLKKQGYKILCENYCNYSGRRIGEIDIIAEEGNEIVFVEVKTRTLKSYNLPPAEESITSSKLHKLNKIASFYIKNNNLWDMPYRFDAICVYFNDTTSEPKINHLKSIFL